MVLMGFQISGAENKGKYKFLKLATGRWAGRDAGNPA
jgi:hypothetical protein